MSPRSDTGASPEPNDPNEFSLLGDEQTPQEDYPAEPEPEVFDEGYDAAADAAAEVAEWIDGEDEPAYEEACTEEQAYGNPELDVAPAEMSVDQGRGGVPWFVLGIAVAAVGIAAPIVGEPITQLLGKLGSAGTGLLCTGLALLAIGAVARSVGTGRNRLEQMEAGLCENRDTTNRIAALVDHLINLQQGAMERRPASGEELDRVLMLLQRQDEKTNNLTRAFKMFGKPLIEVTNTTNDVAQTLQGMQSQLETVQDTSAGTAGDVREALKGGLESIQSGTETTVEELKVAIAGQLDALRSAAAAVPEQIEGTISGLTNTVSGAAETQKAAHAEQVEAFEGLDQRFDEVQQAINALQGSLTGSPDTETIKTQLDEAVQAPLGKLSETLEANTSKLSAELEKLAAGKPDDGHLDSAFQKLHHELAGLSTTLAGIQHKLSQGVPAAAGRGPAPAPAPTAPARAPAPQTKAQGALGGGKPAGSGDYASGERKASNKNVLGAIAKLKQMRD